MTQAPINIHILKIYYSESQLNALGVDENSLKIYYWNQEEGGWALLDSVRNVDAKLC